MGENIPLVISAWFVIYVIVLVNVEIIANRSQETYSYIMALVRKLIALCKIIGPLFSDLAELNNTMGQ